MIFHIIEFIVDYFTNLNIKKILGGILALVGIAIIGKVSTSSNPNNAVLYAIMGIIIGGIGFVIIYHDIAKDKAGTDYDELSVLSKGLEQKETKRTKIAAWHMEQESNENSKPNNQNSRQ